MYSLKKVFNYTLFLPSYLYSMTKKQTWLLLLLLFDGLIFSSMILFKFNLHNGFEFLGWKFSYLPFPFFDFAHISSGESALTSTLLGYLFFIIYGLVLLSAIEGDKRKRILTLGLIIMTLYSVYFESLAMLQDLKGKYMGQHLWNGPVLFILGLLLLYKKRNRIIHTENE